MSYCPERSPGTHPCSKSCSAKIITIAGSVERRWGDGVKDILTIYLFNFLSFFFGNIAAIAKIWRFARSVKYFTALITSSIIYQKELPQNHVGVTRITSPRHPLALGLIAQINDLEKVFAFISISFAGREINYSHRTIPSFAQQKSARCATGL